MAKDDGFDLISVSSDDDDDEIVIQAGARHAAPSHRAAARPVERPEASTVQREQADSDAGASEPQPEAAAQGPESDLLEGLTEEEKHEYAKRMARKRRREEEAMVTTESDLHAKGPFKGMHTLIVVIGIAIVIASLVWYYLVYAA